MSRFPGSAGAEPGVGSVGRSHTRLNDRTDATDKRPVPNQYGESVQDPNPFLGPIAGTLLVLPGSVECPTVWDVTTLPAGWTRGPGAFSNPGFFLPGAPLIVLAEVTAQYGGGALSGFPDPVEFVDVSVFDQHGDASRCTFMAKADGTEAFPSHMSFSVPVLVTQRYPLCVRSNSDVTAGFALSIEVRLLSFGTVENFEQSLTT